MKIYLKYMTNIKFFKLKNSKAIVIIRTNLFIIEFHVGWQKQQQEWKKKQKISLEVL